MTTRVQKDLFMEPITLEEITGLSALGTPTEGTTQIGTLGSTSFAMYPIRLRERKLHDGHSQTVHDYAVERFHLGVWERVYESVRLVEAFEVYFALICHYDPTISQSEGTRASKENRQLASGIVASFNTRRHPGH